MSNQIAEKADFLLMYDFNAPKELVFNAFSNAEALNEWWGPVEMRNSVIKLDFRPGGIFHFKMESERTVWYGRFLFITINPYDLLEFSNAFADEHANVVSAPFDMPFPKEIFYRIIFTENNRKTSITLTGRPLNATAEEMASFKSIRSSMEQGFGATFDKLTVYLSK
jgi:uncharacterized protein YndB with AHSA1/START domain